MIGNEQMIGVWRRSARTLGFWARTIPTLGLYYLTFWRSNQITLTNRRVTQHVGSVINAREISINVENVADINLQTSFLGSILSFGDISIQSMGSDAPDIKFNGLAHARKLRDTIFEMQNRAKQRT